jgi:protein-serine/threonine kinase
VLSPSTHSHSPSNPQHIARPSITIVLGAFVSPTHPPTSDAAWSALVESTVHQIWSELCGSAVAWMHSVSSFTATSSSKVRPLYFFFLFDSLSTTHTRHPPPHPSNSPTSVSPGSRHTPLTCTRCGSEAYAAPELVAAGCAYYRHSSRATGAWACAVVLFAICVRRLSFWDAPASERERR